MSEDLRAKAVEESSPPSRSSNLGWLKFLVKLAMTLACLGYVYFAVDMGGLLRAVRGLEAVYFLAAVGCWIVMVVLSGVRWAVLAHPLGLDPGWWPYIKLFLVGNFFNAVLPTFVGGDVVRGYYLSKQSRQLAAPSTTVIMDRNAGVGGLILVSIAASMIHDVGQDQRALQHFLILFGAAWAVANVAIFWPFALRLIESLARTILGPRLGKRADNLLRTLETYRSHLPRFGAMVLFSAAIHMVGFSSVYLVGVGLGLPLPFVVYLVLLPIVAIITLIPLSIGGLGVRETASLTLFAGVGLASEQSVALSLLWYLLVLTGGIPGLAIYLWNRESS